MEAIKKQEKNYESLDISEKGGRVSPELFIKKKYGHVSKRPSVTYFLLYLSLLDPIWPSVTPFDPVWHHLTLSNPITPFGSIWQCLNVRIYP